MHTSRYTRQWFAGHQVMVLMNAPVNSPDLNPIENFWAKITHDWINVFPRTKDRLEDYIVQCWEAERYNSQYFLNLYNSMAYRMQAVIDNNGGMTKY